MERPGRGTVTRAERSAKVVKDARREVTVLVERADGPDHDPVENPDHNPDDNEVIEAIIHASRAMVGIAIRSLTGSDEDVTLPQYRTLVVLSDGGARRLADLAGALNVSPSTATRMCDRLVRKGLITRTRDDLDRREVNLEVTAAGRATVMDVINRRRSEVCSLLTSIPLGSRRELVDSLRLLSAATGDAPELHWMPGWHE